MSFKTSCLPEARVGAWVTQHTKDADSVLDLGCGRAQYTIACQSKHRCAIDSFAPYVEDCKDRLKGWGIHFETGDIMQYREFFPHRHDVVLLIDVIEHFTKEDGLKLLAMVKEDTDKILIFTPRGYIPNELHDNNAGNAHLSGWTEEDLHAEGFTTASDLAFHMNQPLPEHQGAIWAVWVKP